MDYYKKEHLADFPKLGENAPELAKSFFDYYGKATGAGALTEREKALIGLGVAHALQCSYCIEAYTRSALGKGSNAEEMTEAVHVASAVKAGSTLVHAMQMRDLVKKLSM